jgi:hypothetical protein
MRRMVATAIILAAIAPAHAQDFKPNLFEDTAKLKTDVEIKTEREREQAYKSGISKIPDAKGKVDPWGTVRGAATPPPAQNPQRPASR